MSVPPYPSVYIHAKPEAEEISRKTPAQKIADVRDNKYDFG